MQYAYLGTKIEHLQTHVKQFVEDMVDDLVDFHETYKKEPQNEEAAYQLLVLWAKLQRMNPELLSPHEETIRQISEFIQNNVREIYQTACEYPDPEYWQERLRAGIKAFEEGGFESEFEREFLFRQLFIQLDDMDLFRYIFNHFRLEVDYNFNEEEVECLKAFSEGIIAFFIIEEYVKILGTTIREDLTDFDIPLAVLTGMKFFHFKVELRRYYRWLKRAERITPEERKFFREAFEEYLKKNKSTAHKGGDKIC